MAGVIQIHFSYIYIIIYTSNYIRTYCLYIYTHMHTYIHPCMHACIHTLHPYIHTSIHTYIHPYIHTNIHTYIHPSIHTSIHPSIHTYIHNISMEKLDPFAWCAGQGTHADRFAIGTSRELRRSPKSSRGLGGLHGGSIGLALRIYRSSSSYWWLVVGGCWLLVAVDDVDINDYKYC